MIRYWLLTLLLFSSSAAAQQNISCDLLIVGGTESGCAAAVQAARMGVPNIVLVNDIEWLGGQFSAEGLGAIDENRAHGYNGTVPIPRSGIFRDVIDAIEQKNARLYGGIRRPGNTRVITTSRPVVSEAVFRDLLAPYEKSRQLRRYSHYDVSTVLKDRSKVVGVVFSSRKKLPPLTVKARLTIDASDWGDVIKASGAAWDAGVDAKSEYDEPSAPDIVSAPNDMNPITWCMILEQRVKPSLFPEPHGYDKKYFTGQWGWIDEEFAYTSRRLVDGQGFEEIHHPDILLINTPPIDYPLDAYPAEVAKALEATERGAAGKNIVAMTPQQRRIVFDDARRHSLKFYHYLQQQFSKFRFMALSDEFGTHDHLPPKPYIRESLRLVAQHVIREQEVIGFGGRSNYATTMFPDAVFSWQFELDFHPTKRSWQTDKGDAGPWEATFRGSRRFGRGGTGRCVFPLRSLVPNNIRGLIGAQKNLGYTSIVSSSCRLHDQSIHAGQAAGAVAAVSLKSQIAVEEMASDRESLASIWTGLLEPSNGAPLAIWPFADLDPFDPDFATIQHLALRRLLPLGPSDTCFRPDEIASSEWIERFISTVRDAGYEPPPIVITRSEKRRLIAARVWRNIRSQPFPDRNTRSSVDADRDGLPDVSDALPFTPGTVSWTLDPKQDGNPDVAPPFPKETIAFNFTSKKQTPPDGYTNDIGAAWNDAIGYGWRKDLSANTRLRRQSSTAVADGFVFTRQQDTWECKVANGRWLVCACIGDAGHPQPGQYLKIQGQVVANDVETAAGVFHEVSTTVTVDSGRLILTLGKPEGGSNTCLNWLILSPVSE